MSRGRYRGFGRFRGGGLVENRRILTKKGGLLKNSGFSGGNASGLVLLADRGFSEKWGFSW